MLAYADDVVVLAENEDSMRSLMARLERYLDRKGLVLDEKKSKIMRFRKGGKEEKESEMEMEGKRN